MKTLGLIAGAAGGPDRLVLAAFVVIVLFLGSNFVGVRFSNRELDPFWGAFLRFLLASATLLGLVTWRRLPLPRGPALTGALLYGTLSFGGSYAFGYTGMLHVPAGTASVVFATVPLSTLLLAVLFGLEALTWQRLLGALTVIVGIGIVFFDQLQAAIPLASLVFMFASTLCSALGVIVVKRFPRSNPLSLNAIGMGVGTCLLGTASLLGGEAARLPQSALTWLIVVWLGISSVVAFVLTVWLLARWSASATSYTTVLIPLVTVLIAALLAGETVSTLFVVGGLVVILGVYVGALAPSRVHAPEPRPSPDNPG